MSNLKKKNSAPEVADFPVKIQINNYLVNCKRDKIGKCQAVYAMLEEIINELRHSKNSPRDVVDDIKFLIDDYFDNQMINIIHN